MGLKKFSFLAVAAALLVVTALFVLMLKGTESRAPSESPPVQKAETTVEPEEADTSFSGLKEAGVKSERREDTPKDTGPLKGEEEEPGSWRYLNVLLSSVNRDLKIIITGRDGALVTGVPFKARLTKDGKVLECEDSDMDGIIAVSDLSGGKYEVHLNPVPGYISPEDDSSVNVRSGITYEPVDYIRTIIKTEEEIDPLEEDTADIEEEDDGALLNEGGIDLEQGTIGIDVSKYNKDIDWEKVKASGIEYAIIRLGYRGSSTGSLVTDPYFEKNIKGAREAGIKTGVYFFTQALNETEAVEEASMVESLVSVSDLELPVFLDVESSGGRADSLDKETRTGNIRAFIETLRGKGYSAGLYANKRWLTKFINAAELEEYPVWLAQYKVKRPTYDGKYDAWQYSSKGMVEGIEGYVDLNLNLDL